jgi:hypothetical protein
MHAHKNKGLATGHLRMRLDDQEVIRQDGQEHHRMWLWTPPGWRSITRMVISLDDPGSPQDVVRTSFRMKTR